MNWDIFLSISLLLDNTLKSQYFTCDFLSLSTAVYSHYDSVVLTSLAGSSKWYSDRKPLYNSLQVV